MLSCKGWVNFLNNSENKKKIIKLVLPYFHKDGCRNSIERPLIINSSENAWQITKETIEDPPTSNHEEAVKRLIFYEAASNEAVIMVGKDMDVLLLLLYTLDHLQCAPLTW